MVGSIVLKADGNSALVALEDGVYILDLSTGVCSPNPLKPELHHKNQLTEGKVDSKGRFIVGSRDQALSDPNGKLYLYENGSEKLTVIDDDLIHANGPCWSNDHKTFYLSDSIRCKTYAYDYNMVNGEVSNRREFASTECLNGVPCGATVDAEDHVWSAVCHSQSLVRYRPDGSISLILRIPTKFPASVTFGGFKLNQIFVTSLNPYIGNSINSGDGRTYVIDGIGIKGVPEFRFACAS